jgi:hypothetical protein
MTDSERQQVLKMIEEGKISPEEGLKLMQALDDDNAADVVDVVEAVPAAGQAKSDPEFDPKIGRFRRLWMIPLWSGVLLSTLSAAWMYTALQNSGLGFWFYCAFVLFLLGVATMSLGLDSRTSRWIYLNVHQPNDKPERIVLSFPLAPVYGLLHLFARYIPAEHKNAADANVLDAILRTQKSDEPFFVDVHNEGGQHVQVYIG